MKKSATIAVLITALLAVGLVPGDAWARGWHPHAGRVVFWVGGPWPWWYYPPPYYPYYVYAPPPPVIVQEPPVYVQQPVPAPAPPVAYWYYCESAKAYYPTVPTCPQPWIKVPARSQ